MNRAARLHCENRSNRDATKLGTAMAETVADTWAWMQSNGAPVQRSDRPTHGLEATHEAAILDDVAERRSRLDP